MESLFTSILCGWITDKYGIRCKLLLNSLDTDNVELRAESLGSTMKFFTVGTEALELDASQNATFTGTVYIPSKLEHTGDSDTFLNFSDDTITLSAGGSSTTFAGNGSGTFSGDVRADSFKVDG